MPGWTNVWTMPIQNRVDMLATGVNTAVGVRVLGRELDDVVAASEAIAAVAQARPGRGRRGGRPGPRQGLSRGPRSTASRRRGWASRVGDVNDAVETALGGKVVDDDRRGPRAARRSASATPATAAGTRTSVRDILVPTLRKDADGRPRLVPLGRGRRRPDRRGAGDDQERERAAPQLRPPQRPRARRRPSSSSEARRVVADEVTLPDGRLRRMDRPVRARGPRPADAALIVLPLVLAPDLRWSSTGPITTWPTPLLMMLAVPGRDRRRGLLPVALRLQVLGDGLGRLHRLLRHGDLDGIIMLVYLREAVEQAGGLASADAGAAPPGRARRGRASAPAEAADRGDGPPRPGPDALGHGVGAEVIRPMAAPVLGGILVADEVIDLLLPVAFYAVRRRRLARLDFSAPSRTRPSRPIPRESGDLCRITQSRHTGGGGIPGKWL